MKTKAILWLKAARLKFHILGMIPVLLGSLIAFSKTGSFNAVGFALSELITVLVLVAAIFSNDYVDSDTDRHNESFNVLAGHRKAQVEGLIPKNSMLAASFLMSMIAIGASLFFVLLSGNASVLFLSLIGLLAGMQYSHGPLKIGHRVLGESLLIVMYSFFCILFGYISQAGGGLPAEIIYFSVPVGIGMLLIILSAEIADLDHDLAAGKSTIPVLFGKEATLNIYLAGILLLYLSVAGLYLIDVISKIALLWILLSLPLAVYAGAHAAHKSKALPKDAQNVCGVTIFLYFWICTALCVNLARS